MMFGFNRLGCDVFKVSRTSLNLKCFIHSSCSNGGANHPFKMKSKKIRQRQQNMSDKIDSSNQYEVLSDMVTPHWRISYEQELQIKHQFCNEIVNQVLSKIAFKNNKKEETFVVGDIIGSPARDAYRNKDEFSVWPGLDGDPKTVGFFVGSPALGKVVCVPATHLRCIKESHKQIAQLYQEFIRSSPLPVSYQLFDGGFWRNILVRSNDAGDLLALVVTNPRESTTEQTAEQEQLLREYFSQHSPSLSLFHQSCPHMKCYREQAPIRHLCGQPNLMESLSGLDFRISVDSFFQLNKAAAELMYSLVLKMAGPKHYSTLLDLYCGTGAVSLLAHDRVRGSVGVDEINTAVEDARCNAELNHISNCKFVTGRVELKLANILKELEFSSDIVVVLNPGRDGAAESVISLLRQNRFVSRVIYISCKPDNPLTMKNFVQLCERVSQEVKPFRLTQAVPVDLFPYTSHCELVLCFDRR